jgi:hypothetical protein
MPLLPIPPGPGLRKTGVTPGSAASVTLTANGFGLVSSFASGGPNLPAQYINKIVTVTGNAAASASARYLVADNGLGQTKVLSGISLSLNTGTIGAGGLDSGTLAASSWYYLYAINGVSGTSCLLSLVSPLSGSSPTLPSGYTYWGYLGSLRTDASKNLYRSQQIGDMWTYVLTPSTNTTGYPILFYSGSSIAYGAYYPISLSGMVPAAAEGVLLHGLFGNPGSGSAGCIIGLTPNPNVSLYSSTTNPPFIGWRETLGNASIGRQGLFPLETMNVYITEYIGDGSLLSVCISGHKEMF